MKDFIVFAWKILPSLLEGTILTIELSIVCISIGILFGIILGIARVYGNKPVYWIVTVYVEILRGFPCMVLLFIIYYGLGDIGILLNPVLAAGLALGINTSVYQAEYFRGAILAVKPGQMVAARSMGLSKWKAIRYVIFPQAIRLVLPSSSNEIIYMVKYSSIAFIVGVQDLMARANIEGSFYFKYFEAYLVAALIYLVIIFSLTKILEILEKKASIPGLQLRQG
jgi:polar amino acid transport system permease protein